MRRPRPLTTVRWVLPPTLAAAATAYEGAAVHGSAWAFRAACAAWLLGAVAPTQRPTPESGTVLVGAGVAAAWGLWRAPHFFAGLEGAAALACAALAFAMLRCAPRAQLRRALAFGVALGAGHAAWALAQRLGGATWRGHGGFYSPNDMAALAAPAASTAAGVWASGSRAGLIALTLGALGVAAEMLRQAPAARRRRVFTAGGVALVLAVAALAGRARRDAADPHAYARLAIWRTALAAVVEAPLGYGFGGAGQALAERGVALPGAVRYPAQAHNAHSEWLQAGLELGVPGLALAALAPAWLAWQLARRRQFAQLGTLASLVAPALTGAPLHQPPVAALAVGWAAWAWPGAPAALAAAAGPWALADAPASSRTPGRRRRTKPQVRWTRLVPASGFAAVLALTLPNALAQLCAARAQALVRHGRPEQAVAWLQRACTAAPWEVAHLLHRVDAARVARTHGTGADGGISAYAAVAAAYPERHETWVRLAEALEPRAQNAAAWAEVAATWRRAAELRPTLALLWARAGEAAARARETEHAQAAFVAALAREPHCARAHFGLAELAHRRGERRARDRAARSALAAQAFEAGPSAYAQEVLRLTATQARALAHWLQPDATELDVDRADLPAAPEPS